MKLLPLISFTFLFFISSCSLLTSNSQLPLKAIENNKLPYKMDLDLVYTTIKKAGKKAEWKIYRSKKDKSQFLGKFIKDKIKLYIDISIEDRGYAIYYRKSKNLKYDKATGLIDSKYYKFVNTFIESFNKEVALTKKEN